MVNIPFEQSLFLDTVYYEQLSELAATTNSNNIDITEPNTELNNCNITGDVKSTMQTR